MDKTSPFIEADRCCPSCGKAVSLDEAFVVTQRDDVWHRGCYLASSIVEFPVAARAGRPPE